MKRTVILPLVAALFVGCEKPTGPAMPRPSSDLAPGTPTTFSGEATCDGAGGASAAGSSEIAGLTVNGGTINVSGRPNQSVSVGGVTIVINEQTGSANGNQADITVNALHVTAVEPVTGQVVDVVIASAHADISCGACTPPAGDFVTGGGWITGTRSGARANFAVAGGMKNNGLWGHLTFIDHCKGLKAKGTGGISYTVT